MPRQLVDALEILLWLQTIWLGAFDWDASNIAHVGKRNYTPKGVEKLFTSEAALLGKLAPNPDDSWGEDRFLMVGRDGRAKLHSIIFTIRGDKVRPISVRRSRKHEEERYQERTKSAD